MLKVNHKIQFGFNAVQAGQKSTALSNEPQLLAASTQGKFTITSVISKRLGIAVGENVVFLNNIDGIENAINNRSDEVVQFAEELGVDLNTPEGQQAVINELTVWSIAKGYPMYDTKGNPLLTSERYTREDKLAYIKEHAEELVEANRDALVERVGDPDASFDELLAAINPEEVETPKVHKYSGSKTATAGKAVGVGCQLNFTDSAVWAALKEDLGDDKTKKVRVFNVLLDMPQVANVSDGQKMIEVTAYPIEFAEDKDPMRIGSAE